MNNLSSYPVDIEAQDAEVTEFLMDVDIALGHDYEQPGRQLFPHFSQQFHAIAAGELPLFERLARAYSALEEPRKTHARLIVEKAQALCARSPLGLRRSLACVDLAHEIDPALWSEALYSDLMLRPTDAGELAEWLWQLVRRWHKWNIKVVSTPQHWETAIRAIAPKGILGLLRYFHAQNASDQRECWEKLHRIALKRIEEEEAALLDVGQDPDMLKERIASLLLSPEKRSDVEPDDAPLNPDWFREREQLKTTLRSKLWPFNLETLKDEMEWLSIPEAA